jgi:hypothetical protein
VYLLSDLEEIADAPRRTITWWTEQAVLLPEEGSNRAGRGTHRQYSAAEVVVACVMRAVSQDHVLPIGRMLTISRAVRNWTKMEGRKTINRAIAGSVNLFLILETGDEHGLARVGFFPVPSTMDVEETTKAEKDLYRYTLKNLIQDNSRANCVKTIVFLNPWLSRVREPL